MRRRRPGSTVARVGRRPGPGPGVMKISDVVKAAESGVYPAGEPKTRTVTRKRRGEARETGSESLAAAWQTSRFQVQVDFSSQCRINGDFE